MVQVYFGVNCSSLQSIPPGSVGVQICLGGLKPPTSFSLLLFPSPIRSNKTSSPPRGIGGSYLGVEFVHEALRIVAEIFGCGSKSKVFRKILQEKKQENHYFPCNLG